MATPDTQGEQMDIKMKEVAAREYEVPVPMIKMKECEAYATLPYKPWHPQTMDNHGVVLVVYGFSLHNPFVDFLVYMMGNIVLL